MAITGRELRDIATSALLLAFCFSIAVNGGIYAELSDITGDLPLALVGVSLGFIFHELGHRFTARRYGCFAQYQMWMGGLLLALFTSLLGFVFAAPGAVVIYSGTRGLTYRSEGIISLAGPGANLLLSLVFGIMNFFYPASVFELGAYINAFLALFNLLPLSILDGAKIFRWDKRAWLAGVVAGAALLWWAF
jgi:Zn-dependent protease